MYSACRAKLEAVRGAREFSHPGLALSRYLPSHASDDEKKLNRRPEIALLNAAAASQPSEYYKKAFDRWTASAAGSKDTLVLKAVTAGSLAVGLGNASPLENGLAIHHTYGMPIVPGSAVKGLCRGAGLRLLAEGKIEQSHFDALFGKPDFPGRFVFHDAWYDPSSEGKPFHRDVITVHHPKYYGSRGENNTWPTDFDDPNPIAFLVVPPRAKFLFTIRLPDPGWESYVRDLLTWALTEMGVGAKTNAGYGRFDKESVWTPPPPPKIVTWENCMLTKSILKGAVTVTVKPMDGTPLVIPQSKWQAIELTLSKETRERLKKPMRATVVVRIENGNTEAIRIEPSQEETA